MESELDERLLYAVSMTLLAQQCRRIELYLLVHVEFSEDLSSVQQVLIIEDPFKQSDKPSSIYGYFWPTHFFAFHAKSGRLSRIASQYPFTRKRMVRKA
jgi:hypothetical protein